MRRVVVSMSAAILVAAILNPMPAIGAPVSPPGGAAARADVNGDGIADLIMSTSARQTFSGDTDLLPDDLGGSVMVVPGGSTIPGGKTALVNQANLSVNTAMEADDKFGVTLVTGDFNGDGLADVAVGNPTESIGTLQNAGIVSVLYGQSNTPYLRLIPGALDRITQDTPEVPGGVEAGDLFGAGLAVGDFNADGYADLAIGAPGEALGTTARAGAVWVFRGSAGGLITSGLANFNQGNGNLAGGPEVGDLFGWSLAAGDVTGDGRDDLAIVSPGEAIQGVSNAWGSVHLVPGAASGLNINASSWAGAGNAATIGHWRSVVIGKFHGGAFADVVVYADQRRGTLTQNAGALVAIRGGASGLISSNIQTIDQNSPAIPGGPESDDYFGGSLAAGDIDGDGYTDLAVGVFGEDGGAGGVTMLRGGTAGLLSAPGSWVGENTPGIDAFAQSGEGFGVGLRILDITGDGVPELLASAPREDFALQAGTLFVVHLALSGESFAVTGSSRLGRAEFGLISHYGPGAPIAGEAVVRKDNQDVPF